MIRCFGAFEKPWIVFKIKMTIDETNYDTYIYNRYTYTLESYNGSR